MSNLLQTPEILKADQRLKRVYGEPRRPRRDPVSQLVATMLSQATTDVQTARSFAELRRRFPTWEQVRDAPASQIAKAIRSSGLSKQKAPRIKQALQHITRERGRIELHFLKKMPADEARQWLMRIAGVGPKTASIVLLFSFQKPLFPVDTHIFRVTKRLGWVPENATAEKAHEILGAAVPPKLQYRFHLNLIQFGREICQARKPKCEVCPLTDSCQLPKYRSWEMTEAKRGSRGCSFRSDPSRIVAPRDNGLRARSLRDVDLHSAFDQLRADAPSITSCGIGFEYVRMKLAGV